MSCQRVVAKFQLDVSRSSYQRINAIGQHLWVNTTETGSYDYLSKYGFDWLGHVICLHNYHCYATPHYSIATPTACNTTATPYISTTTQCYTIHLYYYTGATPYISITTQCYTIHLYYYTGATPYISITTQCYTIHFYYCTCTVLHHTFLLLHGCYTIHFYYYMGATPYISITAQCYTIRFYYYTGATPYISITTQVLHHTSLLLHSATPYISITTQCYT